MLTKKDIAELEAASKTYKPARRPWTEAEKAVLRTFYRRVPMSLLIEKLGRTSASISAQVDALGLTCR